MGKPDAYMTTRGELSHDREWCRIRSDKDAIPLYAIDAETRAALKAGIDSLRRGMSGFTHKEYLAEQEKHIAALDRLISDGAK